jgi:hypothetical protein
VTFQDSRRSLLAYVRNQIRNGDLTERGFARLIGISQPHAHNVLKGARELSPEIFDLVLKYFHLSLLDLAPLDEIAAELQRRRAPECTSEVGLLDAPVGPGQPWPSGGSWCKTFPLPFPLTSVPAGLVMVRLVTDPCMPATLAPYDIALLDTTHFRRSLLSPHRLYVVERRDEAVLRYVRPGAHCYYLVSDAVLDNPSAWEQLPWSSAELSAALKARVRWLGRERDCDGAGQRERFL